MFIATAQGPSLPLAARRSPLSYLPQGSHNLSCPLPLTGPYRFECATEASRIAASRNDSCNQWTITTATVTIVFKVFSELLERFSAYLSATAVTAAVATVRRLHELRTSPPRFARAQAADRTERGSGARFR